MEVEEPVSLGCLIQYALGPDHRLLLTHLLHCVLTDSNQLKCLISFLFSLHNLLKVKAPLRFPQGPIFLDFLYSSCFG